MSSTAGMSSLTSTGVDGHLCVGRKRRRGVAHACNWCHEVCDALIHVKDGSAYSYYYHERCITKAKLAMLDLVNLCKVREKEAVCTKAVIVQTLINDFIHTESSFVHTK